MRYLEIPQGTNMIDKYEYSHIRDLEEVVMPNSVERIDRHAFYNCRALKKVTLPGHLKQIEDGAFKNCHELYDIVVDASEGETRCIKNVINDMSHQICISVVHKDGMAKLVVPGYMYDYELDVCSKVFHEVPIGSGHAYQNCVGREEISYSEYDWLFFMAKNEEHINTVYELAMNRLMFPYKLEENDKRKYVAFLQENGDGFIRRMINENNQQALRLAGDYELFVEWAMDDYLSMASEQKKIETMAFLMEYRNKHFSQMDQEFSFDQEFEF
ncbi:MAG: leucine-rich repeat domain-containing protein [Lachnospiraceae bacterium]|nr:leucine-rich repeat domain-containing protein [Lachnospiraceae bacterium]